MNERDNSKLGANEILNSSFGIYLKPGKRVFTNFLQTLGSRPCFLNSLNNKDYLDMEWLH